MMSCSLCISVYRILKQGLLKETKKSDEGTTGMSNQEVIFFSYRYNTTQFGKEKQTIKTGLEPLLRTIFHTLPYLIWSQNSIYFGSTILRREASIFFVIIQARLINIVARV